MAGNAAATIRTTVALLFACSSAGPLEAQVAQMEIDAILHEMTPGDVAKRRSMCAMGRAPKSVLDIRAAGVQWPDASTFCVAILTRQGRDGSLGYVRDPQSNTPTPAIAFDSGFVGGFLRNGALPAEAPTMATLLPIAERCLEQREADRNLCNAAGQMIGARASHGEVVSIR